MKKIRSFLDNRRIVLAGLVSLAVILGFLAYYLHETEVMPQASIYFLDDVALPQKGDNVLVFSPHPDDETLGAGGYIIESIKRGANVEIVLVTDGNKHGLKDQRYEEFKKSTGILGVSTDNLVFLNYADGRLKNDDQSKITSDFKVQIDSFKPKFVLYTDPLDAHPDHATTGKIVEKILTDNSINIHAYRFLIHAKNYPQPKKFDKNLFILPPVKLVRFDEEWQRLMLTKDEENQKYNAMSSYKTQLRVPILRGLMMSFVRKNELFSISSNLNK